MANYRQQTVSSLGLVTSCSSCAEPCGVGVTIPSGQQGYYNVDFDAGETVSDTGAIIIYFNPQSVPDGIRVLYDSIYYNTVTNNTEGRIQSTSGVSDAFTILGSAGSTCVPSTPNTTTYNYYNGFTGNTWNAGSPATQSITINSGDDVRGGASQYNTLVIPKTSATPNIVSIQVLGPCSGTAWNVSVSCPAALPSVLASAPQSTDACQSTQNTSVYFAKNYNDTNTAPIVGNFVFTDENGATPLNNTSTVQYYITGTIAFSVLNGVVVSSAACNSVSTCVVNVGFAVSNFDICNTTENNQVTLYHNGGCDLCLVTKAEGSIITTVGANGFFHIKYLNKQLPMQRVGTTNTALPTGSCLSC